MKKALFMNIVISFTIFSYIYRFINYLITTHSLIDKISFKINKKAFSSIKCDQ